MRACDLDGLPHLDLEIAALTPLPQSDRQPGLESPESDKGGDRRQRKRRATRAPNRRGVDLVIHIHGD